MNFTRTIKFTLSGSNADLLQETNVKSAIKGALGLDDASYSARLTANPVTSEKYGFIMKFDIVSDNDSSFMINGKKIDLIAGTAYSSGENSLIYSLTMGTGGTGTISMEIKR